MGRRKKNHQKRHLKTLKRIWTKEIKENTKVFTPGHLGGKVAVTLNRQIVKESKQVNRSTREARRHLQVDTHPVSRERGHADRSTKTALPHHELKTGPQHCFNFSHLLHHHSNSLSVKQCFKFMLCPQPSG